MLAAKISWKRLLTAVVAAIDYNVGRVCTQQIHGAKQLVQPIFELYHDLVACCRGNQFVECPYSGARFQPECKGKISPVGDIAKIGADASGLLCSKTQTR